MFITGKKGPLSPWYHSEVGKKAEEEHRVTIAHRNAVNAEIRARQEEYWRRRIEAAGREASKIWNAPGRDTTAEDKRQEEKKRQDFEDMRGRIQGGQ
jgi:hypothetical protein